MIESGQDVQSEYGALLETLTDEKTQELLRNFIHSSLNLPEVQLLIERDLFNPKQPKRFKSGERTREIIRAILETGYYPSFFVDEIRDRLLNRLHRKQRTTNLVSMGWRSIKIASRTAASFGAVIDAYHNGIDGSVLTILYPTYGVFYGIDIATADPPGRVVANAALDTVLFRKIMLNESMNEGLNLKNLDAMINPVEFQQWYEYLETLVEKGVLIQAISDILKRRYHFPQDVSVEFARHQIMNTIQNELQSLERGVDIANEIGMYPQSMNIDELLQQRKTRMKKLIFTTPN